VHFVLIQHICCLQLQPAVCVSVCVCLCLCVCLCVCVYVYVYVAAASELNWKSPVPPLQINIASQSINEIHEVWNRAKTKHNKLPSIFAELLAPLFKRVVGIHGIVRAGLWTMFIDRLIFVPSV
jgi:hypothetical protein